MKHILNLDVVNRMGVKEALKVSLGGESVDAKPADLVQFLLFNLSQNTITMDDVRKGARIFQAIEDAGEAKQDYFTIEDADYDWLKKNVEDQAPRLFGMNAWRLIQVVEGATPERPASTPPADSPVPEELPEDMNRGEA